MDFTNMRVLVIGDVCLNVVTDGSCNRLAPEAPVPVIANPIVEYSPGMAGNVALNLKNLGANVDLFTFIGEDEYGNILKEILMENNLVETFGKYHNDKGGNTIVKNRIMANGHQVARIDIENVNINYQNAVDAFRNYISGYDYDFVVISDYNKGLIHKDFWNEIKSDIDSINKGLIFVDTKKKDVLNYFEDCILFPNIKEYKEITEYYNMPDAAFATENFPFLVKTASEFGAYVYTKEQRYYSPTRSKEVVDVYGCGDTFMAAFTLYYAKFENIQKALDFANHCCSYVIKQKGCTSIEYHEAIQFELRG